LAKCTIYKYLKGEMKRGKRSPGLIELDLVAYSGGGGNTDPYVYELTDKGQWLVEGIKEIFSKPRDSV
jgi:hypothetical protein